MVERKVMNAIRFLHRRIEDNGVSVFRIVLFGSHAKGAASEESDIDVVIISEDFRRKDRFKRAEITGQAEMETIHKYRIPFDIITMTPEEFDSRDSIIADYAHEGKVVFAA